LDGEKRFTTETTEYTESFKANSPQSTRRAQSFLDFNANLPGNNKMTVRLANDPLRTPLEQMVSAHIGRQWRIQDATDMSDYACHPCAILSGGSCSVFAKYSDAPNGMDQFEVELAGLRLLRERTGILTPTPIGIIPVPGGNILALEAVQAVDRAPRHWRQIGQTLARIHQVKGDRFGLETNGFYGPLGQDNTPLNDWPTFYAERRLWPGLRSAIDSGNVPPELIRQVEKIIARLPELCGPDVVPTLLHGDAQQNNFISTEPGPVVIDPAVHYGNPEVDLAALDSFQPVPEDVFDGYREMLPIDAGFWERRELWKIRMYLAAVAVEGSGYLRRLAEAVRKYI
jgi:protein-ribulosamine 3-kinase